MKQLTQLSQYLCKIYCIVALISLLISSKAIGFSWEESCDAMAINDSPINVIRADIPFQINGQPVWLFITVYYKLSTGEIVSVSSTVAGTIGNTIWSNYAKPVASYETNQMTIVTNMQYKTSTKTPNTYTVTGTGSGEVAGTRISVDFPNKNSTRTAMTQTGILFAETTVNLKSGYGHGFIQLNGTKSPKSDYNLAPK